jgi:hypothetical protein
MDTAIVFDCEFLTARGAPSRFWCGPRDPDPIVAQIGAVRLGLAGDFPILATTRIAVRPLDREGRDCAIDPFFTELTGLTEEHLRSEGRPLGEALDALDRFAAGARFWSWGKDEFNLVAISAYVAGIPPPIPARRFGNVCAIVLDAGMPWEDIRTMRSDRLAAYFGITLPLRAHDALDDALSVAHALRHLLAEGRVPPQALAS